MDFLRSFGFVPEPTLWDKICSSSQSVLAFILPYAASLYWYIFFTLLVVATAGRKLKLRRFYIEVLDRLFYIAARKIEEELYKEKMKRRLSFMEEEEEEDTDAENELEQEAGDKSDVHVSSESNEDKLQQSNSELRKRKTFPVRKYSVVDGTNTNRLESTSDDLMLKMKSNSNNFKQGNGDSETNHSSSLRGTTTMSKIDDEISRQIHEASKDDSRSTDSSSVIETTQPRIGSESAAYGSTIPTNSVVYTSPEGIRCIHDGTHRCSSECRDASCENMECISGCTDQGSEGINCSSAEGASQPLESSPDSGSQSLESSPASGSQSLEGSPASGSQSLEGSPDCSTSGIQFPLDAPMLFIAAGVRAILDDCVSSSFSPEQVKTWNLLSRTILKMERIRQSRSLVVFFVTGFIFRYFFLMPMRVLVLILSLANLTVSAFLVGCLPSGRFKRVVNSYVVSWGFDFVAGSLSVVARFHNKENRPSHGIAVANHTSPIDGMVLATDNCYDMVGQRTRGLLGMFMNALAKSSGHIWFERSDARDRQATTRLLFEHTQDPDLPPILLFPEGVCVNNTAVLEFRKGAFEVDCDIFPIAVRFDPVYGDAFWFEGGFASYCFSMMTSWAIVCDVFYLPPMRRGPGESASLFASRVRSCIAKQAGLVELEWNSMVKSCVFSPEKWDKLKLERQREKQKLFARTLSQEPSASASENFTS